MSKEVAVSQQATEVSFGQIERMAQAVAKSGLFGAKTPEQAMALMLIAQAEGTHPALAARDYHIIQGRPSLKADTMLARFQHAGGKVDWSEYTDIRVVGKFSHPQAGAIVVEWTIERATKAGLTQKAGPWQAHPRAMLRARCISEGVRTCFPGVAVGMYTVEEAADMEPATEQVVNRVEAAMTTASNIATALTEDERAEHAKAISESADTSALSQAFAAAWTHAKGAKDTDAQAEFKTAYDVRKAAIEGAK